MPKRRARERLHVWVYGELPCNAPNRRDSEGYFRPGKFSPQAGRGPFPRIAEPLQQTRFDSRADLETTLMMNYLKLYNQHIPQRAINGQTPIQALKDWQQ